MPWPSSDCRSSFVRRHSRLTRPHGAQESTTWDFPLKHPRLPSEDSLTTSNPPSRIGRNVVVDPRNTGATRHFAGETRSLPISPRPIKTVEINTATSHSEMAVDLFSFDNRLLYQRMNAGVGLGLLFSLAGASEIHRCVRDSHRMVPLKTEPPGRFAPQ